MPEANASHAPHATRENTGFPRPDCGNPLKTVRHCAKWRNTPKSTYDKDFVKGDPVTSIRAGSSFRARIE
jgi:hypothetical protein